MSASHLTAQQLSFVEQLRSLTTNVSQRNMSLRTTGLDTFFPLPSKAPSSQSPIRLPGITRESSEALVKTLKDDHVRLDAFVDDRGLHKCVVHLGYVGVHGVD